jgi:phage terminase large subunit-like protein
VPVNIAKPGAIWRPEDTVVRYGPVVNPAEKGAVLALIAKWEERLPLIAPGAM